jgi:hypothetical protein
LLRCTTHRQAAADAKMKDVEKRFDWLRKTVSGKSFSKLEQQLLQLLVEHSEEPVSAAEIGKQLWGKRGEPAENRRSHVDQLISRIRRNLAVQNAGASIANERGRGFRLVFEAQASRCVLPKALETGVLFKSARRCCLCFHLSRDTSEKAGQIAHLDRDAADFAEENLAFLCLEHHSSFDAGTRTSKNYTADEIKAARVALYQWVESRGRTTDDDRVSASGAAEKHADEPGVSPDLEIAFDPAFSPDEVKGILTALADYYRGCGGAGFEVEGHFEEARVREPVHV